TAPSHAAIDLTKPAFVALGGNPAAGKIQVDYTVVGGAQFVSSSGSVSLQQSEFGDSDPSVLDPIDTEHGDDVDIGKPVVKEFIASPNFNSRNGVKIDMVVLHFTDGSSAQGAINRFLDRTQQVSAHYIIDRNGDIYQMVHDNDRAWHAKAAN